MRPLRSTPLKALLAFGIYASLWQPWLAMAAIPIHHVESSDAHVAIPTVSSLNEDARIAHVLNRLAYGPRPGDVEAVRRMGINHFIQSQLHPETVTENPDLTARLSQIEAINTPPLQLFLKYGKPFLNPPGQTLTQEQKREQNKQYRQQLKVTLNQAGEARVLRALYSNRQLQEVMTEFWYNHFNIYGGKGLDSLWVGNFEETAIRPYALGRFRDLLEATSHHAAMQFYLDNWQNSAPKETDSPATSGSLSNKPNNSGNGAKLGQSKGKQKKAKGLNENYARELMELHTLGVDGGYTQQDVIALAHILTGWGIAPTRFLVLTRKDNSTGTLNPRQQAMQQLAFSMLNGNGFYFDAKRHDFADKQFLGHTIKGSGEAEGEQALDILARHPATAQFISTELAQYFVSDNPPPALVHRLSQRFQQTDGDIRAVLETLFQSPEFWDSANVGHKYKTPYRYAISMARAINTPVDNTHPLTFAMSQQGMALYGCETPNGYKYTQDAWLSPDGMTQRINFAMTLIGKQMRNKTTATNTNNPPPSPEALAETLIPTLGVPLSEQTQSAIMAAPQALRPSLILSSPEFMHY